MPIQPIDNLLIAPRSQEASQVKHQDVTKVPHEQITTQERFHQHVEQNARQTVEVKAGENKEYRYDAKEKGNGRYSGRGKDKKSREKDGDEEVKQAKEIKSSSFDIKI